MILSGQKTLTQTVHKTVGFGTSDYDYQKAIAREAIEILKNGNKLLICAVCGIIHIF